MCGIVGVVSKDGGMYSLQKDIFEEMLYADALRGMDSTGVFSVTRKNQVKVVKQAVEPGLFLKTKSYASFKDGLNSKTQFMVGHNRKATVGDVVSKNAHPFVKDGIVLVHN